MTVITINGRQRAETLLEFYKKYRTESEAEAQGAKEKIRVLEELLSDEGAFIEGIRESYTVKAVTAEPHVPYARRLDGEKAAQIRFLLLKGHSPAAVAKAFKSSPQNIFAIKSGLTWKDFPAREMSYEEVIAIMGALTN